MMFYMAATANGRRHMLGLAGTALQAQMVLQQEQTLD